MQWIASILVAMAFHRWMTESAMLWLAVVPSTFARLLLRKIAMLAVAKRNKEVAELLASLVLAIAISQRLSKYGILPLAGGGSGGGIGGKNKEEEEARRKKLNLEIIDTLGSLAISIGYNVYTYRNMSADDCNRLKGIKAGSETAIQTYRLAVKAASQLWERFV